MKTVAEFKVQYQQFLNENAELVQPLPEFAKDIQHLVRLYRNMVLVRLFDAKAVALQRTGKMGTFPSSLGQEAISIGVGDAMIKEDVFCPYYRDQGAMIERGVTLEEILSYWGGDERGMNYAGPREDLPISVPIATQCLHATGVAFAMKYRQQARAAVTTIGDGGTSEGAFYEAINLAGAWELPVVFIVNNNQWAISVPRHTQTHCSTIAQKAFAAGIPGIQVDGNDVIAVREVTHQALKAARQGKGPTLIEAITYRLCDHTTADDMKRYSDPQDLIDAKEKEPLKRLRHYLTSQGAWDDQKETALQEEHSQRLDIAVKNYTSNSPQPIENILDFMYKELPVDLLEQREILLENAHD